MQRIVKGTEKGALAHQGGDRKVMEEMTPAAVGPSGVRSGASLTGSPGALARFLLPSFFMLLSCPVEAIKVLL